jgi:hypothetical protein
LNRNDPLAIGLDYLDLFYPHGRGVLHGFVSRDDPALFVEQN